MNILIIGSGGREHAIGHHIKQHNPDTSLYFLPGNAGTATLGTNITNVPSTNDALCEFAKTHQMALTIVGPENPLVAGIVDIFEAHQLPIIGPNKQAAQLEGSKEWAKALMKRHGIPTADFNVFTSHSTAQAHVQQTTQFPIVIKADGLAAGKGVTIAQTLEEAEEALYDCFIDEKFKDAGHKVVIESFLEGDEASVFAFTDSHTLLPMLPAQDHKRLHTNDEGPNTGGMGAYCPTPLVTPALQQKITDQVFTPLMNAFKKEGICYKGILYAGLMISKTGDIHVVEFNARFGDPETQVVLPLLKNNVLDIFFAIHKETLHTQTLEWKQVHAAIVVLAAGGYPHAYNTLTPIKGLSQSIAGTHVIHAGTTQTQEGTIVSNGGRVLGVVGMAATLSDALAQCYKRVDTLSFDHMHFRTDIGQRAASYTA